MAMINGDSHIRRSSPEFQLDEETARRVGQMILINFDGYTVTNEIRTMIENYYVGNIVLSHKNIRDGPQVAVLTKELQTIAQAAGYHFPLMIGIDQENGMISRFGDGIRATHFPGAMSLGATRAPNHAFEIGRATAKELAAVGINWNFAPVLDVTSEQDGTGPSVRSFGDDPQNVGRFGQAFSDGLRAGGIASCAKHFPGTSSKTRRDSISMSRTMEELEASELVPFRRAVSSGLDSVRLSSSLWTDHPHDQMYPKYMVHEVLRRQIGYEGVVLGSCTDIPSFREKSNIAQATLDALKAGCDMIIVLHNMETQSRAIESIYDALRREEILRSEIYRASGRISMLKEHYLNWKLALSPNPQLLPSLMHDHQILARKVYEAAITVVRDDQCLLPLNLKLVPTDTVLLLAPVVRPLHPTPLGELPTDPFEPLGRALARRHPRIRHAPYTIQGLAPLHTSLIKRAAAVVFVTVNALQTPQQSYQIRMAETVKQMCGPKPFVAVAACDPYDLLSIRSFGTYVCTYEYSQAALETAAAVIFGERHAPGALPVGTPGVPVRRQQKQWFVDVWEKRKDLYASADLWKDCLGRKWPLDASTLSTLLDRPGYSKHFVVRNPVTDELLGLAATYTIMLGPNQLIGSLALLIVRPTHRNLGIGLSLHDVAIRHLSSTPGITSIQLGSIFPRLFPGLPVDIPADDSSWFAHRGWRFEEKYVYDLFMDIDNWSPPESILRPLQAKGVVFSRCTPEQFEALIEFEVKNFGSYPGWVEKYQTLKDTDDIADAVLATSQEGILGAALVFSPVSNNQMSKDIPWPKMLGERNGGLACVSVGRDFRGQGLGLALICASIMELKSRGLKGCFVDWVDWAEFEGTYRQLGFQQWGKYREIWRRI
ncbi:glycoside hydrolase superfamily [Kalaharituber pfeilii]|nr:glycoside hydrolase superfamily [Kalaharituber pfeilii]